MADAFVLTLDSLLKVLETHQFHVRVENWIDWALVWIIVGSGTYTEVPWKYSCVPNSSVARHFSLLVGKEIVIFFLWALLCILITEFSEGWTLAGVLMTFVQIYVNVFPFKPIVSCVSGEGATLVNNVWDWLGVVRSLVEAKRRVSWIFWGSSLEGFGADNMGGNVLGRSKVFFVLTFISVLAPGIALMGVGTGVVTAAVDFCLWSSVLSLGLGMGFDAS